MIVTVAMTRSLVTYITEEISSITYVWIEIHNKFKITNFIFIFGALAAMSLSEVKKLLTAFFPIIQLNFLCIMPISFVSVHDI